MILPDWVAMTVNLPFAAEPIAAAKVARGSFGIDRR